MSYGVSLTLDTIWGYKVGYEILLFNGLFTFLGLWLLRDPEKKEVLV